MRFRLVATISTLFPLAGAAQEVTVGDPPGRLIDLDGQSLHLHCTGTGSPTVVFEAGASSFSIDFALVAPAVAEATRVCTYDRLGHGWSGAGDGRDRGVVEILRRVLDVAGERPPYIMVGASRGGLYARLYAHRFPDEVSGLLLIDPTSEDRLFTTFRGESVPIAFMTAEQIQSTLTPGRPVAIPRRNPQTGEPFDRLPPALYRTRVALDERLIASFPDSVPFDVVASAAEEERALLAELWELRSSAPHPLGDRPLIVLSRGVDTNEERIAAFDRLARLSSNSRHTVVADAGHEIHLYRPEVVTQALLSLVEAVRTGRRVVSPDPGGPT